MQIEDDMLANGDGHAWAPSALAGNGHDGRGAFGRLRPSLASLMVEEGVATAEQLEEALQEGKQTGERLGEVVVRRGWINEAGLAELLARQWDLTFVALSMITVEEAARTLVSRDAALRLGACPIGFKDRTPLVAVADPGEDRFEAVRERLGDCAFIVTTPSALSWLIDQSDAGPAEAEPVPEPAPRLEVVEEIAEPVASPPPPPVTEHVALQEAPVFEAPSVAAPPAEVPEPADDSVPAVEQLDRLVERLVSERSRVRDELDGFRRRLDELDAERAQVEESLRAVEAKVGEEDRLLDSMRSKLTGLS